MKCQAPARAHQGWSE